MQITHLIRRGGIALMLVLLSACSGGPLGSITDRARAMVGGDALRSVSLRHGVRYRAPEGWCIDRTTLRARDGFAMITGCNRLEQQPPTKPPVLAVVQVSTPQSAIIANHADDVAAMLNEGGDLSTDHNLVDVTATATQAAVFAHAMEGGVPVWRGFRDVAGVLVTVSVRALPGRELDPDAAAALVVLLLNGVVSRSGK